MCEVLCGGMDVERQHEWDSTHLRLPNLVVSAIHLQLPQQSSNGLPAGLDVPGQQHLELLCEVLARGREGQCKPLGSCSSFMSRARFPLLRVLLRDLGPYDAGTAGMELRPHTCSVNPTPKLTF